MRLAQRLERLEAEAQDAWLRRDAERLAGEFGISVEQTYHDLQEAYARIKRYGTDETLRMLAREQGRDEAEVRASFDEAYQRELERRPGECD